LADLLTTGFRTPLAASVSKPSRRGPETRPCCIEVSADGQDDVVVDDFTRPVRIDSRDAELVDHRNTASRAIRPNLDHRDHGTLQL